MRSTLGVDGIEEGLRKLQHRLPDPLFQRDRATSSFWVWMPEGSPERQGTDGYKLSGLSQARKHLFTHGSCVAVDSRRRECGQPGREGGGRRLTGGRQPPCTWGKPRSLTAGQVFRSDASHSHGLWVRQGMCPGYNCSKIEQEVQNKTEAERRLRHPSAGRAQVREREFSSWGRLLS